MGHARRQWTSRAIGAATVCVALLALRGTLRAQDADATIGLDQQMRAPICVSADGRRVLYVTPGESNDWTDVNELVRYDVDSAAATRILPNWPAGRFAYPAISKSARTMAVQFQRGPRPASGDSPGYPRWYRELLLADLPPDPTADLQLQNINVLPPTDYSRGHMMPAFGAEGDTVVVSFGARANRRGGAFSNQRIWIIAFDPAQTEPGQQNLRSISQTKSRDMLKADEFSPLVWPDTDKRLMFVLAQDVASNDPAVRLCRRPVDATTRPEEYRYEAAIPMTMPERAPGVTVPVVHTLWPTTAPGSRVIIAQVGGWNLWSLVAFSADDSDTPRVVLEGTREASFAHPSLAPGGKWMVYERQTLKMADPPVNAATVVSRSVHLRNLTTGADRVLITNACYPVIAPDGRVVYCFARESDESPWQFRVLDLAGAISPRDLGQLEPAERERLSALVAQLGDDSYTVRRDASNALKQFGERALHELRRAEVVAEDPEVKLRLLDVIEFLSTEPPRPPDDDKPRRDGD